MITKALLMSLLVWIGSHTSYDVSGVEPPHVEYRTTEELQILYYSNCKMKERHIINAVYWNGRMFLNKNIDIRKKEEKRRVVHELVHHLQVSPKTSRHQTYQENEKEAIEVANAWGVAHGLKKEEVHPIFKTACS